MTESERNIPIAVFGSSRPQPGSSPYQLAYETGAALARAGYQVVNGGYQGIMAGSAQGAKESGGQTLGITCTLWPSPANRWIDREIRTTALPQRLFTLVEQARGFVVLPGSTGTLLELASCWELINKKFLVPAPLICLGNFWRPVIDTVVGGGETDGHGVVFTPTVAEMVVHLDAFFRTGKAGTKHAGTGKPAL